MKKYKYLLITIISVFIFSSCSKTMYFTKDMRYTLYKSKIPVNSVQFYNSRKIVLKRVLTKAETKVARGEIKFENGQYVEETAI